MAIRRTDIHTHVSKSLQTTQTGLEPVTSAVTGRRSNQLSHWAIKGIYLQNFTQIINLSLFGQALDRLVAVRFMCYHTSTPVLST